MKYECDIIKAKNEKTISDMVDIYLNATSFEEFLVQTDLKVPHATWMQKFKFKLYWLKHAHKILAYIIAISGICSWIALTSFTIIKFVVFDHSLANGLVTVCIAIFTIVFIFSSAILWDNNKLTRILSTAEYNQCYI